MIRVFLATIWGVVAAACASSPPPVPPPVSFPSQPIYLPPVVYGPPGDPANPSQGPFQPNAALYVCPGNAANAPPVDRDGRIANFNPIIVVADRVVMATVPVNDGCFSSGFGPRGGRVHKGADFAPRPRGEPRTVYTAAPGIVREAKFSNGLGYNVVIDHGYGVYTRYAHLASFEPWVQVGAEIGFGHPLGEMGRSGRTSGVHLHFEVLTGDINTPRGSFGLQANDPLAFPAWEGLGNLS